MKKRILLVLMAVCVIMAALPTVAFAAETSFEDMPNDYSTAALEAAVENGLLNGSDGKIMPGEKLTRAQMAAIISRAFNATTQASLTDFTDVSSSAWYYTELGRAVQMKILQGDGALIRPNDPITRQEAFTVIARALNLEEGSAADLASFVDQSSVSSWAVGTTAAMVKNGYVQGAEGKLNPTADITRKDFAVLMNNIVSIYITKAGTVSDLGEGSVMVNVPGVKLSNVTVTGDLIIGDGVGNGEITLDNVKVLGTTIVRGGGVNSIIIKSGSSLGKIVVSKVNGNVRVRVENGANVEIISISDGKDDVIVEGNVDKLEIAAANVPVTVKGGTIGEVTVTADKADVTVASTATVSTFMVSGDEPTLSVLGTVKTLTATENATNANISVEKGAKVGTINAAAEGAAITGKGTVTNANVTGNNVSIDTTGTTVKVASGVTGATSGDKDLTAGKTTTTGESSSGGSSGGGTVTPASPSISLSAIGDYVKKISLPATFTGLGDNNDATIKTNSVGDVTEGTTNYGITGNYTGTQKPDGAVSVGLTYKNSSSLFSDAKYPKTRMNVSVTSNNGENAYLLAYDGTNTFETVATGYLGLYTGQPFTNFTTISSLTFFATEPGTYTIKIDLADVSSNHAKGQGTVLASGTLTVTVLNCVDLTSTIGDETDAFYTTFYNKNLDAITDKEDAYYVELGSYNGSDDPTSLTIGGTSYASTATKKISVGNNHFLETNAWTIDNGTIKVALPVLCVSAMPEGETTVTVGGQTIVAKLYDNEIGKLTCDSATTLDAVAGALSDVSVSENNGVITITQTLSNRKMGVKATFKNGETALVGKTNYFIFRENTNGSLGITRPEDDNSTYALYGSYNIENDGAVTEPLDKNLTHTLYIPNQGYVTINFVFHFVNYADLTSTIEAETDAFYTTFYNKNLDAITGNEAAYYVELGSYNGSADPTSLTIGGTSYASTATKKISVGNNHFLETNVWTIDNGKIKIALPVLCVSAMPEGETTVTVGGQTIVAKLYGNAGNKLTCGSVASLGTVDGASSTQDFFQGSDDVTVTQTLDNYQLGVKVALKNGETDIVGDTKLFIFRESSDGLGITLSEDDGITTYGLYGNWSSESGGVVSEARNIERTHTLYIPNQGYVTINFVFHYVVG